MVAPFANQEIQEVPLLIAGGNKFGRYPKISREETFNMIVSDNALVDYGGYKNVVSVAPNAKGRGAYSSFRGGIILFVLGNQVYTVDKHLFPVFRGNLTTTSGGVFIVENNNAQIAITDTINLYVYNYSDNSFTTMFGATDFNYGFPFNPGYISFQNGRLIIAALGTTNWVLSAFNDALTWPNDAQHVGELQTKPDYVQAPVPMPGGGNVLFLFGKNVAEKWTDLGLALFPYQRASTFNVDYGCLNSETIAELDNYIVWLSGNEQAGAVLMVCNGGSIKPITTDGLDFKFSQLKNPNNCIGFLIRQDGHLLYQFTFIEDNLSYLYDFNTNMFFTVTDENLNYHIARKVVFFQNKYYFVSINGGNLYEIGTNYTNYQYSDTHIKEIPRIRVCSPVRLPSSRPYIARSLVITIENGRPNRMQTITSETTNGNSLLATESGKTIATESGINIGTESSVTINNVTQISSARVDLSISRDGGETFGNSVGRNMNLTAQRKSIFNYLRLGRANDTTYQLQFWGFDRFVVFDGVLEVYQ